MIDSFNNKQHVLVAMSGGVDSSMAAVLLLEQGYQVTGLMLHLWCENEEDNQCCTPESIQQARGIASQLGMPFYVADAAEEFKKTVVGYFFEDYLQGKTPNPCYICNRLFRWKILEKWMESIGADLLATGHYARIQHSAGGSIRLLKGLDGSKDQSYMLSGLNQEQLAHTIFPLGEIKKADIREKALRLGLPVAEKKDSQDLCFLGNQDYRDFLKNHLPSAIQPGSIVMSGGEVIGQHEGLAFYTIGQRKGLEITSSKPMYVTGKDIKKNQLIVNEEEGLGGKELIAEQFNWISGKPIQQPGQYQVKIRYRAEEKWAMVEPQSTHVIKITFMETLRDITPGQIAVVYDGDYVLGSGIIQI